MMGWPTIAGAGSDKYMKCAPFPSHLVTSHELRSVLGNSIHLVSAAAFMSWVFAHSLRRDVVKEFLPPLRSLGRGSESAADDGEDD